jgi:hypothetical protein
MYVVVKHGKGWTPYQSLAEAEQQARDLAAAYPGREFGVYSIAATFEVPLVVGPLKEVRP